MGKKKKAQQELQPQSVPATGDVVRVVVLLGNREEVQEQMKGSGTQNVKELRLWHWAGPLYTIHDYTALICIVIYIRPTGIMHCTPAQPLMVVSD